MFYFLYETFDGALFNVFRYITFRAAYAAITAFLMCIFLGPFYIRFLKRKKIQHQEGEEKLAHHLDKVGTPTMGGGLILISIYLSLLLWGNLGNRFVWLVFGVSFFLGILGFADDYLKWTRAHYGGLSGKVKLLFQALVAFAFGAYLYKFPIIGYAEWMLDRYPGFSLNYSLMFPFFKYMFVSLGYFYIIMVMLVVIGSSNAVNLTDGLDGLAIGCLIFATSAFAVFAYLTGHFEFSQYLRLPFIKGIGELTVFLAAVVGAAMGFLWYNAHPAQIFMGDTGSLSLGGILAAVSILVKQELTLLIIGGVFVFEALSVILQVASFRIRGKRIFLMAPIHHHFEKRGIPESKITVRFWIVAIILALVGLSTIKLR